MNYKEIEEAAKNAIDWATGSWGQGQYDRPKFSPDTMARLYRAIADIAIARAEEADSLKAQTENAKN
jgi:hypothetical protein